MECEYCKESLKYGKTRFCNEYCRSRWYRKNAQIKDIINHINNNTIHELHQSIRMITQLGFKVSITK